MHSFFFFFFNDTATTEIYTLPLHDALPISSGLVNSPLGECPEMDTEICLWQARRGTRQDSVGQGLSPVLTGSMREWRSEEHTSELQSQSNLVCRLLLEKKKQAEPTRVPLAQ